MSFAKVYGAQVQMLSAHIISVEIDLSRGLYAFTVVGLPDKAVEESRDRVSAAIKNSGFDPPKSRNQKIVISLAPADMKKEGPNFDVAIALAYLLAEDDIRFNPEKKLFIGELSLDGDVRGVPGILPLVLKAREKGFTEVFVPHTNADEAALVENVSVYAITTLKEVVEHLNEKENEKIQKKLLLPVTPKRYEPRHTETQTDFRDIRGQESAKRGLMIAASGGHNIALWGPPGTGKTLLAKAFAGILPPLTFEEMLEVTSIHSVAGTLREALVASPPFRSPHHTSSYVSLIGGGSTPKPGEITLAHRGVLFLDEFPEFDKRVIESLRQPLEDRVISVSRAKGSAHFPADIIVVAALNPCPCGNWGSSSHTCICTPHSLARYARKLSSPIIDRIDMWIEVASLDHEVLSRKAEGDTTETIRAHVLSSREKAQKRFSKTRLRKNSDMSVKDLDSFVPLSPETRSVLNASAAKLNLSARAYHRIIKLARTIADMEDAEHVETPHILEALQYRPKAFGV
ncbi:MAG: YifB family Mg chelatase-like AAA ATPase [Patescibacteria group bacterium]